MKERKHNGLEKIMKLVLLVSLIYCSSQGSIPAVYTATNRARSGTWTAFTTLKTQTDVIPSYNIVFTSPLANQPKLNAVTSVSSFDLLSSTQFSFNTTVSAIAINGFTVKLQIFGNTYINLIKLNYLGMAWPNGQIAQYLYVDCFLTSDLSYISTKKSQQFTEQQLSSVVADGTVFDVQSFITGLKFFNNKDSSKKISVNSYIQNNTDLIAHEVYVTGNTIVQWICMGTIVVNNAAFPWDSQTLTHMIGTFTIDRPTSSIDMATFPTGYLPFYNQPDRMFFGLVEIQLSLGKPYQIIQFKSQNSLALQVGFMSLASGGKMAYFFTAFRRCTDLVMKLFSLVDQLCWDTCPDGQFKHVTWDNCIACHFSCETRSGMFPNQCLTCDAANFRTYDPVTKQCLCNSGYVENNVPICPLCSDFIPFCTTCSSPTVCLTCISTAFTFNPITIACECAPNTYVVPANNVCAPYPGCLSAQILGSAIFCQNCDTAGYFQLDTHAYECKCVQNYVLNGALCVDKCGDGINPQGNSTSYCDDGNLLGGDGCSVTCGIQSGFGCFVPPGQLMSFCSPIRQFTLKYHWAQRVPHQNSGLLVFQVSPASDQLAVSGFTYYVQSSIPHSIATGSYDPVTSLLKIKIEYLQTIQDQQHSIKITLDPYRMTVPSQTFNMKTSGVNYDLTMDSNPKMNNIFWYICAILSGLIVVMSIVIVFLNNKIAAVQLLLSSQIVYLGVLATIYDNLAVYSLTATKYLTGFNTLQSFEINRFNHQTLQILTSGTFAEYLLNYNITPAILVLVILVILPLKINVWIKTYQRQKLTSPQMQQKLIQQQSASLKQMSTSIKKAQYIVDFYIDKVYFSISLITFFPLVVYFSIQLAFIGRVGKYEINSFANIISSILLLLVDFCFFILIFQDTDKKAKIFNFGSKKLKSYPNRLMMAYFFLTCVFTIFLLTDFTLFVLLALNFLVGVYIWIDSPYEKFTIQHIDSLSKPIISTVSLLGIQLMAFFNFQLVVVPIVIIALLFVSMIATTVRSILLKLRRRQLAKRMLEQAQMDDQFDPDQKNLKNSTEDSQFNSQRNKKINGKFDHNLKNKKLKDNLNNQNDNHSQKQNQNDLSAGQLNKDNQLGQNDPDQLGDQNEDQLTRIKRTLRQDLKKRRGVVNKANQQPNGQIKNKTKKGRKITFDQDQAIKQHDI